VLDQPIDTLSKGFKRRVGLAQALLHDPPVLILDEPTDGLDPNQKHEVRRLIAGMPEKAIVISTHILEEVDAVCTRAVIIADGRIVADGTPGTLAARSRHHNAVRIALARDRRDAAAALRRLPSVIEIEELEDGEGPALMVFARDGSSIIAAVAEAAHLGGWPVTAMRVERGRLDDVFRAITLPPP
jgi:ABC-2 type transport system ATP-binding protein